MYTSSYTLYASRGSKCAPSCFDFREIVQSVCWPRLAGASKGILCTAYFGQYFWISTERVNTHTPIILKIRGGVIRNPIE